MSGSDSCFGQEETGAQGVIRGEGRIARQVVEGSDRCIRALLSDVELCQLQAGFQGAAGSFFFRPRAEIGRRIRAEFALEVDPLLHALARGPRIGRFAQSFAQHIAGARIYSEDDERSCQAEARIVPHRRR